MVPSVIPSLETGTQWPAEAHFGTLRPDDPGAPAPDRALPARRPPSLAPPTTRKPRRRLWPGPGAFTPRRTSLARLRRVGKTGSQRTGLVVGLPSMPDRRRYVDRPGNRLSPPPPPHLRRVRGHQRRAVTQDFSARLFVYAMQIALIFLGLKSQTGYGCSASTTSAARVASIEHATAVPHGGRTADSRGDHGWREACGSSPLATLRRTAQAERRWLRAARPRDHGQCCRSAASAVDTAGTARG